jgi:hypothetical protein
MAKRGKIRERATSVRGSMERRKVETARSRGMRSLRHERGLDGRSRAVPVARGQGHQVSSARALRTPREFDPRIHKGGCLAASIDILAPVFWFLRAVSALVGGRRTYGVIRVAGRLADGVVCASPSGSARNVGTAFVGEKPGGWVSLLLIRGGDTEVHREHNPRIWIGNDC